jgi:hypothetical protein
MDVVSLATSLSSEEQQNKFAQLLFKTHMSYLDTEDNQSKTSWINLHFQKCLQKVNLIQILNPDSTSYIISIYQSFTVQYQMP